MRHMLMAMILAIVPGLALAEDLKGVWVTSKGESGGWLHISMAPCGDALCGTIVKAFGNLAEDGEEPVFGVVTDYAHLGRQMITNMATRDGKKYSGNIWDPETDKTFKSTMALMGDKVGVKGCVAGGLFCKNLGQWSRL